MSKYFIEEDDFYLRGVTEEDIKEIKNWPNDSKITKYMVMGTFPNSGALYCSWDDCEIEFKRLKESKKDIIFSIVYTGSKIPIGIVGLYDINWLARNAEFRIVIGNKAFQGQHLGTKVTKRIIRYGFEKLNLHKIYLGVNASDKRANKCYCNAGFIYEGTIRDYHFRNGRYYNANMYSILASEVKHEKEETNK